MDKKIGQLAAEARKYFSKQCRDDGSWHVSCDGKRPKWVSDMIFVVHNASNSWDTYRVKYLIDALDEIAEAAKHDRDFDDIQLEPDVFGSDLLAWLGSRTTVTGPRAEYVDKARAERGVTDNIMGDIAQGQLAERQEVLRIVLEFLRL
jgi:hypothetical protein